MTIIKIYFILFQRNQFSPYLELNYGQKIDDSYSTVEPWEDVQEKVAFNLELAVEEVNVIEEHKKFIHFEI